MFICNNCWYGSPIKIGKCPDCGQFGTFSENKQIGWTGSKAKGKEKHQLQSGTILDQPQDHTITNTRRSIQHKEIERVLQNGVKQGGIYLLGGEPWIGKSTIILQIIHQILQHNGNLTLAYFSGEENSSQIRERRQRVFSNNHPELIERIRIYHATHLEDIVTTCEEHQYDMIIVDSMQTIYSEHQDSAAWSPNQVKYCAEKLSEFCKGSATTARLIGHVTKGGEIAWPKYLEHIVDVVLYLEGDRFGQLRFLRSQKNRFGHTDESAIFEMTLFGLQPVYDLKERILSQAHTSQPGTVLTIGLDNGRPVIAHVEVLLNKTQHKYPQRNCVGVDTKRVDLLIAVLEKYLRCKLHLFDIYVNIPGEFKFFDSGLDLAIAAAIISQYNNTISTKDAIYIGEIGLAGQITKTKFHDKRTKECPEGFTMVDYQIANHITKLS